MNAVYTLLVLACALAAFYCWFGVFRWLFAVWFPRLRRGEERPGRRSLKFLFAFWALGALLFVLLTIGERFGLQTL